MAMLNNQMVSSTNVFTYTNNKNYVVAENRNFDLSLL